MRIHCTIGHCTRSSTLDIDLLCMQLCIEYACIHIYQSQYIPVYWFLAGFLNTLIHMETTLLAEKDVRKNVGCLLSCL